MLWLNAFLSESVGVLCASVTIPATHNHEGQTHTVNNDIPAELAILANLELKSFFKRLAISKYSDPSCAHL
jgi:hypothetical protein